MIAIIISALLVLIAVVMALWPEGSQTFGGGESPSLIMTVRSRPEVMKRMTRFTKSMSFRAGTALLWRGPRSDVELLRAMRAAWLKNPESGSEDCDTRGTRRLSTIPPWPQLAELRGKDIKYLDIGSADGCITAAMAKHLGLPADKVFACDVTQIASETRATPQQFNFVRNEPWRLPFEDGQFQFVTMFMSAHHFEDAPRMFSETARVMTPGGLLLIREHGYGRVSTSTTRLWLNEDSDPVIFYDLAHAFFEVVQDGADARQWAERYHREGPMLYQYRDADGWAQIAIGAGFKEVACEKKTHGIYDAMHLLFSREERTSACV